MVAHKNSPDIAWRAVKHHDDWIRYRWQIVRKLEPALVNGLHFTIDGVEFKVSERGYGWKFVSWEPFAIYTHISQLPTGIVKIISSESPQVG